MDSNPINDKDSEVSQDLNEEITPQSPQNSGGEKRPRRKLIQGIVIVIILISVGLGTYAWLSNKEVQNDEIEPEVSVSQVELATSSGGQININDADELGYESLVLQGPEEVGIPENLDPPPPVDDVQVSDEPEALNPSTGESIEQRPIEDLPQIPSLKSEPIVNKLEAEGMTLSIEVEKETYEVNEAFEARFHLEKPGEVGIRVLIADIVLRDDLEARKVGGSVQNLSIQGERGLTLGAFDLSESGYSGFQESFAEPGVYTFSFNVYRCSDIYTSEDACEPSIQLSDLEGIEPLASISQTITVVEVIEENSVVVESTLQKEGYNPVPSIINDEILNCLLGEDTECLRPYVESFSQNLTNCTPSNGTTSVGFEPFFGWFRAYEILGLENGNCRIDYWFLDNSKLVLPAEIEPISDDLLNKKMTCFLTEDELAVERAHELKRCEGDLKDVLAVLNS